MKIVFFFIPKRKQEKPQLFGTLNRWALGSLYGALVGHRKCVGCLLGPTKKEPKGSQVSLLAQKVFFALGGIGAFLKVPENPSHKGVGGGGGTVLVFLGLTSAVSDSVNSNFLCDIVALSQ